MKTNGGHPAPGNKAFDGYHQTWIGQSDQELTRVGPGTAMGEYLRRYWQPVAMASELGSAPKLIRILGEDLVLFRETGGRLGLVQRRCPHRRASLEFGLPEARGIRCCYHGWLFDVDGTPLEVPGQPEGVEARICKTVRLGAYPVYDTLELEGHDYVPYKAPFHCNWLQVLDAIVDPIHTAFLHSSISREQFSQGFGELGEYKFYERQMGFLGTATRRVGENVWVRTNELVLPNYTQAGAAFAADGTKPRYYGRTAFARWVVPLDDTETLCYAWAVFGDRGDPPSYNTPEGPELIEQGEVFDRTYEEKQRFPADAEATEGMGIVTEHEKENLVPSDKGIVLYRKRLRELVRALQKGEEPRHARDVWPEGPIPTYGGDTVLRLPKNGEDDGALLRQAGQAVMQAQFDAEGLAEPDRVARVVAAMKAIEAEGTTP
jgi:nitrite reductase/ring-hydroxylating ferredoxin subunit